MTVPSPKTPQSQPTVQVLKDDEGRTLKWARVSIDTYNTVSVWRASNSILSVTLPLATVSIQTSDSQLLEAWKCIRRTLGEEGPTVDAVREAIVAGRAALDEDCDLGPIPSSMVGELGEVPGIHVLKADVKPLQAIIDGHKTFEFRRADRNFKVGDMLHLTQWDPVNGYGALTAAVEVLYILHGPCFGIPSGFCIMSIKVVSE
jgi:hypothetical protein